MLVSQTGSVHCGNHKGGVVSALYSGHWELLPRPQRRLVSGLTGCPHPSLTFFQGESRRAPHLFVDRASTGDRSASAGRRPLVGVHQCLSPSQRTV